MTAPGPDTAAVAKDTPAAHRVLAIARSAIAEGLGLVGEDTDDQPDEGSSGPLGAPGACFVTLERDGRLLGCIGTLDPHRSLAADVAANAAAAAFADPRLPAVTVDDYPDLSLTVSVLGPLRPLPARSAQELAASLEAGVDGVLIDGGGHRATFLPSVWEKLPDPEQFLAQLWRKAGLRPFRWPPGMTASTYRVTSVADPGPRPLPPPRSRS